MIRYDSLLQNATDIMTKCDSCFIAKCDRRLLQNASGFLLQNATVLLQNVTVIANCNDFIRKCDTYYKMRRLLQIVTAQATSWDILITELLSKFWKTEGKHSWYILFSAIR